MTVMLFVWAACGVGVDAPEPVVAEPIAIGVAECAVCGMVVGEQPAPRGQVRHRDGTHAHFCSLGDLRAYVQAPNPRGRPVHMWVEALEAGYRPADDDIGPRPWINVEGASFVVGLERLRVMGRPALSFAEPGAAAGTASALKARVVEWEALVAAPFNEDP